MGQCSRRTASEGFRRHADELHAKQCTDQLKEGHETFDEIQTLFLLHSFGIDRRAALARLGHLAALNPDAILRSVRVRVKFLQPIVSHPLEFLEWEGTSY